MINLPAVNTTTYKTIRARYNCTNGGISGLNIVYLNGQAYLIVFLSDTDQYQDYFFESNTLFYEFQDQVMNRDGTQKKRPLPYEIYGPRLTNKPVIDAFHLNGSRLPVVVIQKQSLNRWAELYCDCVCIGYSRHYTNDPHYFQIKRSRVPWWLLAEPVVENEEE